VKDTLGISGLVSGVILLFAASASFLLSACGQVDGTDEPVTVTIETNEGTALNFDISSDGSFIVFDLLDQLWRLPVEGGRATPITDAIRDTTVYAFPSISPDGEWVSYTSVIDPKRVWERWLMSLTTGEKHRIDLHSEAQGQLGQMGSSAWAPDGTRVAFCSGSEFWVYSVGTGEAEPLDLETGNQGPLSYPDWHPGGDRVAFQASAAGQASPGRIWEADLVAGTTVPITPEHLDASVPRYSPSGSSIGFLFQDSTGITQVGIEDLGTDDWHVATNLEDVYSFRWSPSGEDLLVMAKGRLWKVPLDGGAAAEIPFTARVEFQRPAPPPPLTFPEPGSTYKARGYSAHAISPDGRTVGVLALGKLWVVPIGGSPHMVTAVYPFTRGMSWSPSGREIVWSGGEVGLEDLFVTDVATGATRQLTALPGREDRPSWSPDGSSIAFVHWEKPALDSPWLRPEPFAHLRVLEVGRGAVAQADETLFLGEVPRFGSWISEFIGSGMEGPTWSPTSDAVLCPQRGPLVVSLDAVRTPITGLPGSATFLHWSADSTIVYVDGDRIYRAELSGTEVTQVELLTADAAVSPTVALDGSVLYRSSDGLRVRRPDGSVDILGWPIEMAIPEAPAPMVLTNVRVFDATTGTLSGSTDILLEGGRVAEVAPFGTLDRSQGHRVVDARGRIAIPGLIDLHIHSWDLSRAANDLFFGITTVRDLGSMEAWLAALRDATDAGVIDGPRIVMGGPQFYGGSVVTTGAEHGVADLAGIERALDLAAGLGVRHAKLYLPGPLESSTAFIREARERGMRITGHVASPLPMVAAGMDGKEHISPGEPRLRRTWYDDLIQLFSKSGMSITATVEARRTSGDDGVFDDLEIVRAMSPALRIQAPNPEATADVDFTQPGSPHKVLGGLIGTGVLIGAGSDRVVPSGLHGELEGLVLGGMSPAQALIAATSNAARILGAEASIGTIEGGKLADIVILDADPLDDIRNTRKIWMVIKGGRIIDREAILESNRRSPKTGG